MNAAAGAWSDRPVHPVRLAALLALLGMFGPFAIDAMFPAFKAIAADLQATPLAMQQTISVYLIAYAAMSLIQGPLSDAFGRRPVIIAGVAVFTIASIGCALAQSIEALLFWRAIQGCSTGAGQIVGRAIVRDLYDGPQAQKVMSLITLFFAVAPALAPVIGGVIYSVSNWHMVFGFLALYGVVLLALCWRVLPETHPVARRTPFRAGPLLKLYVEMLRDWRLLLLIAASGLNFGAQFVYIASAPMFVEVHLKLGTMGYAWFFVPMIIGMMVGAMLCNRMAGVVSSRRTLAIGYAVMALAMVGNLVYNFVSTSIVVPWAVVPVMLNAIGVAIAFPVLSLKTLDRFPEHRGAVSSLQAFIWGVVTALIAGVMSPALSNNPRALAIGAALLVLAGWLAWRVFVSTSPAPEAETAPGPIEIPHEA